MRTVLWLIFSTTVGAGIGYHFNKLLIGLVIGLVVGLILRFCLRWIVDILEGLESVFD